MEAPMNNVEKAALIIDTLPDESIQEFALIAAISPFNIQKGGKITAKGAAFLGAVLRKRITEMEIVSMTELNPITLEAANLALLWYKVSYNILETLCSHNPSREKHAKLDDEFFLSLEKMPIIREILITMAKNLKRL